MHASPSTLTKLIAQENMVSSNWTSTRNKIIVVFLFSGYRIGSGKHDLKAVFKRFGTQGYL